MDDRTRRLLADPLVPTLAQMAVPNILVMLVQTSVGLIETYFVSALGIEALAGMALVFPVVMLVQMLSAGGMGGAIQSAISRALGAGHQVNAGLLAWHATALGLALGIATSLVAPPFGPILYAARGGTGDSLRAATTDGGIVLGAAVLIWLFNAFSAVIRGTGNESGSSRSGMTQRTRRASTLARTDVVALFRRAAGLADETGLQRVR